MQEQQHYVKCSLMGESLEIDICKNHLNTVLDLKRYFLANRFNNKGLNQDIDPWVPHLKILKRGKIDLVDEYKLFHPDLPPIYFKASEQLREKLIPQNPNKIATIKEEPVYGDLRTDVAGQTLMSKFCNHLNNIPQLVTNFLSQIPQSQIHLDNRTKQEILNDLKEGKNIFQNIYQDYSQPELNKFSQEVHDLVSKGHPDLHLNQQALEFVSKYKLPANQRLQRAIRLLQGANNMKNEGFPHNYLNLRALGHTMSYQGQLNYQQSHRLLEKIEIWGKDKLPLKYALINCQLFRHSKQKELLRQIVKQFTQKLGVLCK